MHGTRKSFDHDYGHLYHYERDHAREREVPGICETDSNMPADVAWRLWTKGLDRADIHHSAHSAFRSKSR